MSFSKSNKLLQRFEQYNIYKFKSKNNMITADDNT